MGRIEPIKEGGRISTAAVVVKVDEEACQRAAETVEPLSLTDAIQGQRPEKDEETAVTRRCVYGPQQKDQQYPGKAVPIVGFKAIT